MNYVRLRVWNNPASGYNNKAKVLQYAKTVKAKGLKLLVDFHYSDTWADPGKQYKPAAWASHGISQLQTDVYDYTYDVCNSLKAQGTTPDSVQIGNEINVGMLWNDGKVINNDFTNLSLLLKSGYNATKSCNSGTKVIIHTADADSDANARWFYDGIKAKGVSWDITGLSYYCMWHGTLSNMSSVVVRHEVPLRQAGAIIAETAYPFTAANADSTGNSVTSGVLRLSGSPGRARPPTSPRCRTPPAAPARSASSTGSRPGTPSPATAGTRPTSPAPATAGTTWPSSTGPAT